MNNRPQELFHIYPLRQSARARTHTHTPYLCAQVRFPATYLWAQSRKELLWQSDLPSIHLLLTRVGVRAARTHHNNTHAH